MSASRARSPEPEPAEMLDYAALGSRLVSRLTGLTTRQLQYWHSSHLQEAHLSPGARGKPRRYSWADYQRLRLIAKLVQKQVPTARIRQAVGWLDEHIPDWHQRRLEISSLPPPKGHPRARVMLAYSDAGILADAAGQMEFGDALLGSIAELREEGPLGCLARFSDAITMDPSVNAGLPTLRGTTLETGFLASLARISGGVEPIAKLYELDMALMFRVMDFEEAAA